MSPVSIRPPGAATLMHVAIFCPDVDESIRFYREGLGFSRTYEWTKTYTATGKTVYQGRGVYVELEGETYLELFPGEVRTDGPVHHIGLAVSNVDELYARSLAAGGRPFAFEDWSGEPTTVTLDGDPEMEVRVAFVQGPAGELIELYEQYSPVVTREP